MQTESRQYVERLVREALAEVLGIERETINRNTLFLELGLDSLSLARVIARVNDVFGLELIAAEVFAHSGVEDLSAYIQGHVDARGAMERVGFRESVGMTRGARSASLPLSFAQQRLWFLAQLEVAASRAYHVPLALRLRGILDRQALRATLDRVVFRHESLRTRFVTVDGTALQQIDAADVGFVLRERDLEAQREDGRQLRGLMEEEAAAAFDLTRGPLIRGQLLRLSEQEHVLLITMHHIVSDGWSMSVLFRELGTLYAAYREGKNDPLTPLSVQYPDYAVWQREWLRGERLQKQSEYWQRTLSGAPQLLRLPTDRERPAVQEYAGEAVGVEFDESLTAGLKELSQRHGTTLFMTVLAGWAALLSRLSGQEEVVIGTPVANRTRVEIEELIGFFVNTLAIRVDVSGSPSTKQLLERVREQVLAAQANQDIPFEQLVETLKPVRSLSHSPVFQVMLAWQNLPEVNRKFADLAVEPLGGASRTAQFDLSLSLRERGGRVVGFVEYATSLFEASTVERYLGYWKKLLEGMVAEEARGVDELEIVPREERERLLVEWNRTQSPYPSERCIHELFEEQVEKTPEATAVVYEDRSLSYRELNEEANRLAHYLRERGVGPDARVGICVERGLPMVVGLLGILKAGGAYVPLDPSYPVERLSYLLGDSEPVLLLADGAGQEALGKSAGSVPVIDLQADVLQWAKRSSKNLSAAEVGLSSRHLAYVIYTSGSTGQPKGVMVEQRSVVNFLSSMRSQPGINAKDRVPALTSFSFDIAALEIYLPLTSGAEVVVVNRQTAIDEASLAEALDRYAGTILQATPSTWRMLLSGGRLKRRIAKALCGGEVLTTKLAMSLWPHVDELWNLYGPTETAIWSCVYRIDRPGPGSESAEPIGKPIANTQIYIVDRHLRPVPVGVEGEIYIGGAGVARGYLNRPQLTAERFVRDPFDTDPQARLYRTGDIGRYRADGNIEFLGRNDHQVKIRGYRIELGEIEGRLTEYERIKEAVVLAREDEPGEKRLVAYYTSRTEGVLDVESLRAHLQKRLPEYMVPAAYVRLEQMPLTPNGKLDRKGLPAPGGDAYAHRAYEAPQGEMETALAQIWQELLGVEQVGRHDNFFELGGHSLLAVTLIGRMRQRGFSTDVRALFAAPTLHQLAEQITHEDSVPVPENLIPESCDHITPQMLSLIDLEQGEIDRIVERVPGGASNVQDIYPLAPLQEGILFHHLMGEEGDAYVLSTVMAFDTRERLDRFLVALQAVIDRHDILRTGVMWEGLSEPVQVVWRRARLPIEEVTLAAGDAVKQLRERFDPRRYRLDVREAPLQRVFVALDQAQNRWLLMWLSHHLTTDHTALEVIFAEAWAHVLGEQVRLGKPTPFRNFIAQTRRGLSAQEHEQFFTEMLGEVEEPTAPYGLLDVRGDGGRISEARERVDEEVSKRIRAAARAAGVSAASVCHLAWGQVLARLTGREEVVFGTVLFDRLHGGEGVERGVGLYINTLPVRVSVGETGVEQAVRLTHQRLGGLLRHEHASLALAQRCSGVPASAPLFTTLLNYRYTRAPSGVARGRGEKPQRRAWEGITALYGEERTNYPLTVSVDDLGEGFLLTAQVVEALDPQHICALMQTALGELVKALERAPQTPMWAIDVLPAVERERLLVEWNRTQSPYPSERCIHELFEEQVEKTPEATAVVYEDRSLSYRELNEEANRLAHYLRERGVGVDEHVVLLLPRSIELVISELAVLKCGSAYVPIDEEWPQERQMFIAEDCQTKVVLYSRQVPIWRMPSVDRIDVERVLCKVRTAANDGNVRAAIDSGASAYVMYTSGSSGEPKGVVVPHRAISRLVLKAAYIQIEASDRVAFAANPAFDASTLEVWGPLLNGGRVVVMGSDVVRDPKEFSVALGKHHISVLWLTVGLFNQYADPLAERFAALRCLIVGGDVLDPNTAARVLRSGSPRHFLNGYGPTETTTFASIYEISAVPEGSKAIPIGKPIANTQIYIVDRHLRPVPVGVEGEIYIGGAGVARGYLNRPQLTAERFVRDPFDTDPQARLYRTGDIGRYRADGNIEFLGRNDHQVKIRGYRIELGEIEGRLTEYERIKEAVVLAREDEPGEKRLVAYYTSRTEGVLDVESLRAHLQKRLPEYMVPAAYVRLEQMPLTPNGKLDRKGLPAPGGDAYAHRAYEAPQGEMETALAQIWQELLGVEQVGRHDNFFELGGHSLLAVQLISRVVQRFSSEVSVQKVFQSPTVKALAQAIEQDSAEAALPLQSVSRDQLLPLSFAQQRLWFLAQLEVAASRAYHVPLALRLRGILDRQALRATLDRVVFRHESLRTRFVTVDGTALQQIDAADVGFVLRERDLEAQREDGRQLRGLMEEEAAAAFDLTRGPLIRGQLLRLSEQEHVLLITMHHIVSDGWSMSVLFRELGTLYAAYREGKNDPLTPLSVQYPDYAVWQREWLRGERLQKQSEYWQRTLSGAPQLLRLPTDRERPAVQEYAGEAVGVEFDESLTAGLKELSQRHGTTLFMTVLAGWAALLSRLSGQEEVVIGTPVANRTRVEIEELIGFFVNTLAIRVDVSGSPSTKQLLERVREQVLAAQANQDIPFEQLVETLKPVRSLSHSPVFQVMLAWQNLPEVNRKFADLAVEPLGGASRTAQFDLSLSLRERGGRVVGFVEYATSLFEASTVERYLGYWKKLLEGMVAEEARGVDELEIVPREERERLLVEWNRTQSPYPSERCIHELFEEQVEKTPEATAVVYEDRSLSYRELNEEANRLAHYLRERGVGPDARVGICVERGLPMVVGLLGILKAGGAYVPLDPSYPVERLSYLLGDSEPVLLLADGAGQEALGKSAGSVPVIDLQADVLQWAKRSSKNLSAAEVGLSSRHLAYVIYTSGSTGQPKGVMVEQRSVVNFLSSMRSQPGINAKDRVPALTSFSFDIAALEIYLPLTSGAEVVVVNRQTAIDEASLAEALDRYAGTILQATPSTWRMLLSGGRLKRRIAKALCGGEVLTTKLAMSLWPHVDELWNLYGPTETAIWSCVYRIDRPGPGSESAEPIGKPIANTQIYIVDRHLRPVPVGVEGEIYIGGAGVARGYLNRPQLTAERFVRDPFDTDPQARLYRTGDIGRYRADGNIEFLGRNDHQVKIRGYRIELGEIEGRLTEYERIKEAVVLAREDEPGEKRLVAYYTSRTEGVLDVESLRAHLQKRLPEYMVPAAYVRLEQMPLTPNGKLDRKGLPAPGGDAYAHRAYEAPQGEMETALAQIWQELLGVEQVGRHDNFFELGGHSLLAVQLISRVVQRFSSEVSVQKVFQSPTVKALAQAIEQDSAEAALPLQSVSRDQLLPLSFAQQRLWFLAQLEVAASRAYHVPLALRLRGILDRQALRATLDRVVFRHESLRTRFVTVDGTALQQIDAADVGFVLRERDLEAQREDGRQLRGLMEEEAAAAFDLTRGPLIRGQLLRLSEQEHVLLITMHHIVSDGWSMSVLFRELGTLYAAYREGKNDPLTPLSVQYPDYAVWQREWLRGERLQKQSEYWQRTLSGAPQLLRLPTDRERPAVQEYAGEAVGVEFDESLTAGLKELSQRHGTTLFMTVLAGWAALLSRLSGQEEVVIGTPVANRTRVEIEELIGFFVNTLAIRVDVSGSPSTKQLLERVREQVLAAQANQDIPFEQLVETLKPVRSLSHSPVFQVMLAWQNLPEVNRKFADLAVEPLGGASRTAQFDLSLSLRERGGRVVGFVEYATSLFEASTVERYLGYWKKLLEGMVAEEARGVDELEIVPREERERLLVEWNRTQSPYPSERCIHELFEEQVEKTPEATAVVYEDRSLSYRELNEEANRLAHYLRERGVGPDARVGICVERGLPMVVGLLGILKAGGAYVPLDPSYPVERLSYLLGDSEPVLLLADGAGQEALGKSAGSVPVIDLQADVLQWAKRSSKNLSAAEVGLSSRHLAYVIYTSGSTGQPKGVAIEHRSTTNLICWARESFSKDELARALFSTSINFDLAVYECFVPLLTGGCIEVVETVLALTDEPIELTLINTVPSAIQTLIDRGVVPASVRSINLAGEALKRDLVEALFARSKADAVCNLYGPSETTTYSTWIRMERETGFDGSIGRPIANTQIYIVDRHLRPVPVGVEGEIYIGGAGVARGYLNRPQLTAERFVRDPFDTDPQARLYRTGDIGRYRADGNIEFLGRNDHQVKIRGYRIELGEIEGRLTEYERIKEAVVLAREDEPGEKRLVAYYTSRTEGVLDVESLRAHLQKRLPEYMVPAAYVRLEQMPLTPNGKLDRKGLPAPGGDAYAHRAYEAPQGEMETALAQIWQELLGVEQVGRHDNFFELGGHSLLAVTLIGRMRQRGFSTDVRALFAAPTLHQLAEQITHEDSVPVPENLIPESCDHITPQMLSLIDLEQGEIDRIVERVPGGASNVQDIYPLAPLQEGILFHHLMGEEGDAYVLSTVMAFDTRERLDRFLVALQAVIDRHDILRTGVMWEGLSEPVQVVWRRARLPIEEVTLAAGDAVKQLRERFDPRRYRLDVREAPLQRVFVALDQAQNRWLLMWLSHHLTTDHTALEVIFAEAWAHVLGEQVRLGKPTPFRNFIAQTRRGLSAQEHEQFFTEMLGEVEEPTAPYGLLDVRGDGGRISEARERVDEEVSKRIRAAARAAGVSAASVCHLAWGQVLARLTGREEVVFGTVLFGRLHGGEGVERGVGLYINTLPVRVSVGETGVEQAVRLTHQRLGGLLRHEHASLALAQRCSGVPASAPLFTTLLNYRYTRAPSGVVRGRGEKPQRRAWEGITALYGEERTNYPLTVSVDDLGEGFLLTAQVVEALDPQHICALMQTALGELVKALERAPQTPMWAIDVLPAVERERLLVEWNRTQSPYPSERCIHELFEEQVEKTPEATAVVYEDRSLSYRELNEEANRLAHYLRERGVGPDARVGICVERGLPMVVGLLGILKAGGAYVPLDPSYPVERLSYLLGDSEPVLLLADGAGQEALGKSAGSVPVIDLQADVLQWAKRSSKNLSAAEVGLSSRHLAYVIYTSGSTGQPKGVMVEHRAVNARVVEAGYVDVGADDCVAHCSNPAFDASTFEVWAALLNGARLLIVAESVVLEPRAFRRVLKEYGVTVLHLTTGLFNRYAEEFSEVYSRVRCLMFGGEASDAKTVREVVERSAPNCLLSMYGPTETTAFASVVRIESVERGARSIPIGRPIANTQIYIVDRHLRPVPVGVEGEIYIGGAGVARGYLNRPQLTAERFVRDPFDTDPQARLYRTGDIGRYRADGNIEFLGRNDHQVKIRGYRIELGEIEGRLTEYERIKEAVVLAREDEPGEKRLVAYYTSRTEGVLDVESLRAHLQKRLPEYMVPAAYVRLEQMPLTPNGKLDRKGLPAPGGDAYAHRAYEAPQGEMETALAQIWQELLGVEQVGRHDNFFELGGHSLLAVQLISRVVQRFSSEVSVQKVFQSPTVKALAQAIEQDSAEAALPLQSVSRDQLLPLSFAQQRLWFLAQLEVAASRAYHVPLALRLRGILDRQALRATLDRVVFRHESLRTRFVTVDGTALQQIDAADVGFVLRERDLEAQREDGRQLRGLMEEEAAAAFDLTRGPLIRGQLLRLSEQEHVLLITMHHIVSDGWSMSVLFRELGTLYAAYREGKNDPLTPLSVQYPDYAVWQREWLRGERLQKQSEYWQRTLSGAPQLLRLPTDRERPAVQEYAGEAVGVEFDESLTAGLKELSQRHGTTLFMTVLAGWAALLSRLSGQEEVVIGTPVANRTRVEIEELIGFFVNTLAIRVDVSGSPSTKQLLERVREQVLAAQANQDIPFEQLVETLKPVRSLSHSPVFQVMLAWQNLPEVNRKFADLAVEPLGGASRTAQFDLSLSLRERGGRVVGFVEYATSLFEASTVERYLGYWKKLLEGMVAEEARGVDELEIVPREERERLLVEWNRTQSPYPSERCIHELFEEQVEKTPEATAVVYEDRSLSYRELNEEANRLAHYLRERGVGPDARVGICVERGLPMVVGLLGILKAGGAYVPLDPSYPVERLSYLLGDSEPVLLLADGAGQEALGKSAGSVPVIDLQADVLQWAKRSSKNLSAAEVGLSSRHLAYVIYTSGSTGQPKGVMVEQRSVVNFLSSMRSQPGINAKDRVPALTSFSFDIAALEIYLPLTSGAEVVVVNRQTAIDEASLAEALDRYAGTILQATPSTWRMLLSGGRLKRRIAKALCGGEVLTTKLAMSLWPHVDELWNLYGPTETAIWSCVYRIDRPGPGSESAEPIGKPIANTQIYIVDRHLRPVPVGVEGEIYIGGAGVARGYLNRPQLTAERFVRDPFDTDPQARLYRTGDIGRYRADGNIEFLGRNDHQVKIRGYRIELGEIEGRLTEYERIKEAVVLAREDEPGEKRLVAYYTSRTEGVLDVESLRAHLQKRLPEYMVPAAYVRLEQMPLTPNGKLDRKGLPAPGGDAYAHRAYEAPQGEMETALAQIWQELLGVEQVGRHDNFFELGGHSLLAVTLIGRMRQRGFSTDVRALFAAPTLHQLAEQITHEDSVPVPENLIPESCDHITPQMLSLIDLEQGEIDRIVERVPGGASNVQDIYPLAPLQEGILFHHLMGEEGDAYVLSTVMAFDTRERLDRFLVALQAVIDRHDILRTGVMWEGLSEPVQVVWRRARLPIEEVTLAAGDAVKQLRERFDPRRYRLDVREAPLQRVFVAFDAAEDRWLFQLLMHHLTSDHATLEVIFDEVEVHLLGERDRLGKPTPFRNFVALARRG